MLDWLPENISTFGDGIDELFFMIYYVTVAIFLLINAIYIIFIIKYRRKKKSDKAYYTHGNNIIEFAWTALPFALFAFIALYSDTIWQEIRYPEKQPNPDVIVEVVGQQYMWHVRYSGPDGIFGHRELRFISPTNPFGIDSSDANGKDDRVLINELHLPMNKNIVVRLSSIDVIHSFFLPHLRVKQDAVPGQWVDVWFNGRKTGEYEIACAELCGSGHYLMRGVLTFHRQTDYDTWLNNQYGTTKPEAPAKDTTQTIAARI
jgi:cytochrome c oxidase subunit II